MRQSGKMARQIMPKRTWPAIAVVLGFVSLASPGCTSLSEYVRNGFKVGPNYGKPPAPVADTWIDAANPKVRLGDPNIAAWWCVFDDPVLNELVQRAYSQNLTLRAAGFRILEARAQLGIATGNILPQSQTFTASYSRNEISLTRTGVVSLSPATTGGGATSFASAGAKRFFDSFAGALNLSWELDFWGKFRRAVESADASLDASVENYDFVLVMLLSDVATNYVEYRTLQKRLDLARKNVEEQTPMVEIMERRFKASVKDSLPDYNQLKAN